jgi:FkbM family methyltransferase
MNIFEKFKEIIGQSSKPIVFEFGMCDGYHSNLLLDVLSANGRGFIYHGFEPVKELFDGIHLRYNSNIGQATKHNLAIGRVVGQVEFYKSGGERIENGVVKDRYYGSSSIRKPKLVTEAWTSMTFETRTAQSATFDYLQSSLGLQNEIIDFVWADIQGAEIDMIEGGKNALQKVRYLYTEYNNSELYEGEIGLSGICSLLPNFEIIEDYKGDVLLRNTSI